MSPPAAGRFGIIFSGDADDDWVRYVEEADRSGFYGLGVGDSQSIYPDVYVRLTVAALRTRSLRLGPWVTNPLTRHPAVTASAVASVDRLSHGRAFLGIGTGDSSVGNLGLRPATAEHLAAYLRAVIELQRDGQTHWEGATARLRRPDRRVPVYVGGTGQRALEVAGELADGVVIGAGISPDVVEDCLSAVERGACRAGRRLEDVDVWWLVVANLAVDDASALYEITPSLATFANVAFKSASRGIRVPDELLAALRRLHEANDSMDHGVFGGRGQAELCDALGLTPYLEERFSLSGSPARFSARVAEARRAGAEKFWLAVRVPDKKRVLRLWREVGPTLG